MSHVAAIFVAMLLTPCSARLADVDVGLIDQKPPMKKDLVAPKSDDGIAKVGLHETIQGKVPKDEKRNLYVVVNTLSNKDTANIWWVQEVTTRDGESLSSAAQFGEEAAGVGEYFAILAVATDKKWAVGEMLKSLPDDAAYTKVKIVKRK